MPENQPSPHIRSFVAVHLSSELLRAVQAEHKRLESQFPANQVRWTGMDQVHITLRFLGNVRMEEVNRLTEALRQATNGVGPFQLSLRGIGCFPSWARPSVIWIGIHGDVEALAKLQSQVERETGRFGSHSEDRAFRPHLTIGRLRSHGGVSRRIGEVLRQQPAMEFGSWQVNEIALMRSQLNPRGSVYTRLAVAPLRNEAESSKQSQPK